MLVKTLALTGERELELRDETLTEDLGPGMVLLENLRGAICGSDVDYYRFDSAGRAMPEGFVLLHEIAARVTAIGRNVQGLNPGDIVFVNPARTNPDHPLCKAGLENLDPTVRFLATPPVNGGARQAMVYPAQFLVKIEDGEDILDIIPLIEPTSCCVHGVDLAGEVKEDLAVIGSGPIGTLSAMVALRQGWDRVFMVGITQPRLDLIAKILGKSFDKNRFVCINSTEESLTEVVMEETKGKGVQAVVEAAGARPALLQATEILGARGRLVIVGRTDTAEFKMPGVRRKEMAIVTSYRFNRDDVKRAKKLVTSSAPMFEPMITDRFGLSNGADAFALADRRHPEVMKILINMAE